MGSDTLSYMRKGTCQRETSAKLNPHAKEYLLDQVQQRQNVLMGTESSSQQQVVRPKEIMKQKTTHSLAQCSLQR